MISYGAIHKGTPAMDPINYFATDYRTARIKFLEAATAAGARIETFDNPALGPDGMPLHTDVALLGDPAAERVLLVNSATHGGEGFCGSGCMVGWLRSDRHRLMPATVRTVLVHAINPHGFAWIRRVTEDNIDLNRNFVDHATGTWPVNVEYGPLHANLRPGTWTTESRQAMESDFRDYIAAHGEFALQAALSKGQYDHADGIFYGGHKATWSNRTFREIVARFVTGAAHIGFIDFHTGLGPYGTAELIAHFDPNSGDERHYRSWYGEGLTSPTSGNSTSPALYGLIADAVTGGCPDANVTSITAEYGTYPVRDVFNALLADNWLHAKGDLDSDLGRAIKADMRLRFYPDEDDWKELVWLRGRQILDRAVRGLA
jgi:hypothetical protein